jgi:hypothetical protein
VRAQQVAFAALPDAPAPQQTSAGPNAQAQAANPPEEQRHGLMRVLPNYTSPDASMHLPPMTPGQKFVMATKDSFGFQVVVLRGAIAGINQARDATPEFHQGAAGYGRYFWHAYADAGVEVMMVEFIVPSATREDPRYYRLGEGGFMKRTGYSISRLVVTRRDGEGNTFNVSEIAGAAAAGGISDLYYPKRDRTFKNAMEECGLNVAIDGATFFMREFWPDVTHRLFHKSSKQPAPGH